MTGTRLDIDLDTVWTTVQTALPLLLGRLAHLRAERSIDPELR